MPTARKISHKFKRKKSVLKISDNKSSGNFVENDVIVYSICDKCREQVESATVLTICKSAFDLHKVHHLQLKKDKKLSKKLFKKKSESLENLDIFESDNQQVFLTGGRWKLSFDQLGRLNSQVLQNAKKLNVLNWINTQNQVKKMS